MTFANCPKCGSSDVTTAGVCANCGWVRFPQVMGAGESKEAIYNLVGEIEIKVTGKALLDDYKRLLFENKSLESHIAELEEKQRWIPVSERLPEIINGMEYYDAVVEGEEFVEIALWDGWHKTWNLYDGGDSYSCTTFVTHWRERPTLPEVYGKESEDD